LLQDRIGSVARPDIVMDWKFTVADRAESDLAIALSGSIETASVIFEYSLTRAVLLAIKHQQAR
jgi:hypothetical protein